ncbi:MAG: 50S ribosomal protein L11 methyltransferase [Dehalococcoidia bacterium]|nr:MAG: 50S ribosomal protein L11 methyltransferase [Dehalococcoidia bacterium]
MLRELTGRDVSIERPFTQPDLESDAVVDTASAAVVRAYADGDGPAVLDRARAALASADVDGRVSSREVAEEDWAESWKEHFHIERFGERIVIVPSWRRYEAEAGDVVVTLDPGMAFGTGQHETTRMCLEQLERAVRPGARVLDVGCGSGILAIAAARLGASGVLAVDVDADCVRVTTENARTNGVEGIVRVGHGSLGDAWPFEEPPAAFDVVVANIIARVIVDVAAELASALAGGGLLIVSGVIGAREGEVAGALAAAGLRVDGVRGMGDWRCMEAER